MSLYLTPERYRTMGFGVDISELNDIELLSLCTRASAIADSYCATALLPQRHDFRGGTVTDEGHRWRIPETPFEIGQRRFYPWHQPVRTVTQFRIYVTNTQYVEIAASELFLNNSEGYVEVVSLALTSSGLFNALIIPNVGLATPLGKMSYTYGWDFEVVDEDVYASDAQLYRAQNQFWHTTPVPTVKKNGTVVNPADYTVNYTEGTILFTVALTAVDEIAVSYHHKLPYEIAFATGLLVTHMHGESELAAKGMAGVHRLTVSEVTIQRDREPVGAANAASLSILDPEVAFLLDPFKQITVRLL